MKYFLLSLLIGCFLSTDIQAQDNWRKLSKKAQERFNRADFAGAADYYQKAWQQKKGKKELLYRAAESFYQLRDYQKVSQLLVDLRNERQLFPQAGLLYARALKQEGKYPSARVAFQDFIENYSGADKSAMAKIVDTEIAGCELGIEITDELNPNSVILENPGENINTVATEFGPIPFSDDILYFSSSMKKNKVQIFRSQRKAGNWTNAVEPEFPNMPDGHVGNGSFTPDGKRFYFTICRADQFWNGIYSECDIYVTRRVEKSWSTPIKLRDYIKMDGSTATHPYVTHIGNKEVLYYVTNRIGGKGGMDIWYTTREVDSDDYDFTLPQNAGPQINTPGDEVTPYYDRHEKTLYFSSNGHPSIGGLDIFKVRGEEEAWEAPERLSAPFNSSADDYYYQANSSGTGGFLASNRLFDLEKIETTQDDIFTFSSPMSIPIVKGKLLDKLNLKNIDDVKVTLYELKDRGKKRLLNTKTFKDGQYEFGLIANKRYRIIATKSGYSPAEVEFTTTDHSNSSAYQYTLELEKATMAKVQTTGKPVFQKSTRSTSTSKNPPTTRSSSPSDSQASASINDRPVLPPSKPSYQQSTNSNNNSGYKRYSISSDAPKHEGTYYKVQFTVVLAFNESDGIFDKVRNKGRLDTEYITEKGWTRVLLAEFFTISEARRTTEELQQMGFPDAFVVKYRNGKRLSY